MKTPNTGFSPRQRYCASITCALLLVLMPLAASGQDVDEAELTNLVLQDCGSCHGMTLQGGLGPPLRPADLEALPVEAIAALIREGVPGTAMPPWRALLTGPEILWISEQLKSGALVTDMKD